MAVARPHQRWLAILVSALTFLCSRTAAQAIAPSNNTQDLLPVSTSPRFILNGTEFPNVPVVDMAPLGPYAQMSHAGFLQVRVEGHLVNLDASNANDIADVDQFSYVSCDPEDYPDNLDASEVFRIVVNSPRANIVILYSETSDHCTATGLDGLPTIGGILTTTNRATASKLADLSLTQGSPGTATILPDLTSYTNSSAPGFNGNGSIGQSPTTAVAMIILYSITGIITALFVVIIVTGAIRAHRHPERYGPRNIAGRGRQSRAKGIARAMLETLPIVKFGDHQDLPAKPAEGSDIEMNAGTTPAPGANNADSTNKAGAGEVVTSESSSDRAPAVIATSNPDGTDAEGHLGCSICTEDFKKGEEVRVLPCNHKFHPDCVDPWLLNVSGTCPLCRIDLRPQAQEIEGEERRGSTATADQDGQFPPPLPPAGTADATGSPHRGGRRETVANLRHLASGSREERIAALRRLRQETRSNRPENDEERSGLARRFRERFRIRTERRETTTE
ncbi:uncharacterized protein Z520_10713 [Fonsecaea multimorphosa CBS 102226]|uniref:RING-type domain-containing protein n=1 Tax=Fonsecaea multimorphosa CBS 102226 TaxID=1442371 RepID=A0A0D2GVC8_9EURO|nr:uncharacterized protein Z520_10713 [Fonsecaea multimorphosa CBS 102226]KIX93535.1 hypothetical protein Z520_10713 [Fonsecaea multimorphosa CBS 102226]OAL18850.1 hypothetical protein AYO22_10179 [Fonsecaea multimorphosa]